MCTTCPTHLILLDNTLTVRRTIKDYHCAQNHSIRTTKVSALGNTHCKNVPFVFISHFHCCWVVICQTRLGMSTANLPFHHFGFFSITENGDKCFYSETPCYKKYETWSKFKQNKFQYRESKGNEETVLVSKEGCPTHPTVCLARTVTRCATLKPTRFPVLWPRMIHHVHHKKYASKFLVTVCTHHIHSAYNYVTEENNQKSVSKGTSTVIIAILFWGYN